MLENFVGVGNRDLVRGDAAKDRVGNRQCLAATVESCQRQGIGEIIFDHARIGGEWNGLDHIAFVCAPAIDRQAELDGGLRPVGSVIKHHAVIAAQAGIRGRVLDGGFGILCGLGKLTDGGIRARDQQVGLGVRRIEGIGAGKFLHSQIIDLLGAVIASQRKMQIGNICH